MLIIGVDPGATCGVHQYDSLSGQSWTWELIPFTLLRMLDTSEESLTVVLAVEKYVITPQTHKMTRQYDALEAIGALRYIALKKNWTFELQSRGAKEKVDNETLRRINWWKPTRGGHANDAARHCFMAVCKHLPNDEIVRRGLGMLTA